MEYEYLMLGILFVLILTFILLLIVGQRMTEAFNETNNLLDVQIEKLDEISEKLNAIGRLIDRKIP
ncbi:hypothetical protein M9C84_06475 [SAR86 cluster bacterium]|jgi:hypothetical protein|nr:hypothetical protein M9C84_06475 [SAR86 cluster bacterium]